MNCVGKNRCSARICSISEKVRTPNFSMPSPRGVVPHIHPELLRMLPATVILDISLGEMMVRKALLEAQGRLFADFDGFVLHLGCNGHQNSLPMPCGKDVLCLSTTEGYKKVLPGDMRRIVELLKPDLCTIMSVEIPVNQIITDKKIRREMQSGEARLESLLTELKGCTSKFIANVQGGEKSENREEAASRCIKDGIEGFHIGGIGHGEQLSIRSQIISTVINSLPCRSLRLMTCDGTPREILQGIWLGVDVFHISYHISAAEKGIAFTFETKIPESYEYPGAQNDAMDLVNELLTTDNVELLQSFPHIDLTDCRHAKDLTSLDVTVGDDDPSHHSIAYIHHLFKCHEMLGTTILAWHNSNMYMRLFDAIREAIEQNNIECYLYWFIVNTLFVSNNNESVNK